MKASPRAKFICHLIAILCKDQNRSARHVMDFDDFRYNGYILSTDHENNFSANVTSGCHGNEVILFIALLGP